MLSYAVLTIHIPILEICLVEIKKILEKVLFMFFHSAILN